METTASAEAVCPLCNKSFVCCKGDIAQRGCSAVPLSVQTRKFLARTFRGCLCNSCLAKVEELSASENQSSLTNSVLIENLHYYKEANNYVFTEFYHLRRGYCCRNNCRHCPYPEPPELS